MHRSRYLRKYGHIRRTDHDRNIWKSFAEETEGSILGPEGCTCARREFSCEHNTKTRGSEWMFIWLIQLIQVDSEDTRRQNSPHSEMQCA